MPLVALNFLLGLGFNIARTSVSRCGLYPASSDHEISQALVDDFICDRKQPAVCFGYIGATEFLGTVFLCI